MHEVESNTSATITNYLEGSQRGEAPFEYAGRFVCDVHGELTPGMFEVFWQHAFCLLCVEERFVGLGLKPVEVIKTGTQDD